MSAGGHPQRAALLAAARQAAGQAYAPYSQFSVGAILAFADGSVVSGANVENASYGLSLCAEAVAVAKAMNEGHRGGLVAVAVVTSGGGGTPVTPCGRCRQMLWELAALGGTDPLVFCDDPAGKTSPALRLSQLLPHAFGPEHLSGGTSPES